MRMRSVAMSIWWLVGCTIAECGTVELVRNDDGHVEISIEDADLAVYNTDNQATKPYFFAVRAGDGTQLSRPLSPPDGKDPHHLGIWIAVDRVNGADFWAERNRIENVSVIFPHRRHDARQSSGRLPGVPRPVWCECSALTWLKNKRREKHLAASSAETSCPRPYLDII